jgi:hypothetical protein
MRQYGRNDPCPCGSGRKHKRCCLEVERGALRLAGGLEARIDALGAFAREAALGAWLDAFERHVGHLNGWGFVPPGESEWLDVWFIEHGAALEGRTPLDAAPDQHLCDAALRRSAITAWWAHGDAFPLRATGWREELPATLHSRHRPLGELRDGALVVARGVESSPGHLALAGRPVVVDEDAVGDVLAVLAGADPAMALFAALRWPEERCVTAEGEQVIQHYLQYAVEDTAEAISLLRAAPGVVEDEDANTLYEDDVEFAVLRPGPFVVVEPSPEPGVRWELCAEDAAERPVLGEVTVSPAEREICLSAPSAHRLKMLRAALPAAVLALVGEVVDDMIDVPDVLPRMRRARFAHA